MVVPTYRAFFRARAENRYGEYQLVAKGVDTATVLFHLREHLSDAVRPSRGQLQARFPEYGLVADIANVSKHKTLDRASPQVTNASQISEAMVVTTYRDEQGEYQSAQAEVLVQLDDGTELVLANLLHSVFSMWCTELKALGVGDFHNPEVSWSDSHISRHDAKEAPIELLAGQARKLSFQFREFDYNAGVSKPKDLTGYTNASMNVYEFPKSVPITLRPDHDPSLEVEVDIPLQPDQAKKYLRQTGTDEQQTFLADLIQTESTLQALVQDAMVDAKVMQIAKSVPRIGRFRRGFREMWHRVWKRRNL